MKNKMISLAVIGMLSITMLTGCASTNEVEEAPKSSSNIESYNNKSEEFLAGYAEGEEYFNSQKTNDLEEMLKSISDNITEALVNDEKLPLEYKYKDFITGYYTAIYDSGVYIYDEVNKVELSLTDVVLQGIELYEKEILPIFEKEPVIEEDIKQEEKQPEVKKETEKPKQDLYDPCLDCGADVSKGNQVQLCDSCFDNYTFCEGGCGELVLKSVNWCTDMTCGTN